MIFECVLANTRLRVAFAAALRRAAQLIALTGVLLLPAPLAWAACTAQQSTLTISANIRLNVQASFGIAAVSGAGAAIVSNGLGVNIVGNSGLYLACGVNIQGFPVSGSNPSAPTSGTFAGVNGGQYVILPLFNASTGTFDSYSLTMTQAPSSGNSDSIVLYYYSSADVANAIFGSTDSTLTISLTNISAAATVTAISPAFGPASGGTSVVITGTNFSGLTAVKFGNSNATSYTVNSTTQITAIAPAGIGTVDVTVTTAVGISIISPVDQFTCGPIATQAVAATTLTQNRAASAFTPVTGSSGKAPLTYTVSPALPAGLSISASTGTITGTATVTAATSTYTVTITDANNQTASATFSLTVNPAVTATQTIAAKAMTQNLAVPSFTPVAAGGGTTPVTYAVSPGLPAGLSLNASTGAIAGTPTQTSAAATYTITITDSNGATASNTVSLTVNGAVTATQSVASRALTQNVAVSAFTPVTGNGGTSPVTYTVAPSLPAGLSFSAATGAVTGTPTTASATATYTVTVTDTNGATATATFSLTVNGAVTATQAIASKTLTLNVGASSFTPVTGSGGTSPLSYMVSPNLPAGLSINGATGAVTGTPTTASATATYTVTVTDANSATATSTFSLTVNAAVTATQAIASKTLTLNVVASSFTPVSGSGGTSPLSYTVSPNLPAGLSINGATGVVTGTPTTATATAAYTVTVTDTNGAAASASFSLTINAAVIATQTIASKTLTLNVAVGAFVPLSASGGTAPITFSISPGLPVGLSFNVTTGAISGTPTVPTPTTTYTITVTDANNATASATFSLGVNSAVVATQAIASRTLTQNVLASAFTPVTGSGGTSPLTYVVSPSLPAGLSFSAASGAVTGTPTTASAAATYTVTVTDANSAAATATFSLGVNSAVVATQSVASKALIQNIAVTSFTPVTGSGGSSPLTYAVSPSLPAGLSLSTATGAITGTPTLTSALATYTVTVTDASNGAASNTFTLRVDSAAAPTMSAAFSPTSIATSQSATLTLTISNPNASAALTGLTVAQAALPANLNGASPATTCGGTASLTGTSFGLAGGTIAPNATCTVTLTVSAASAGSYSYTTGVVSATLPAISGSTATTATPLSVSASMPTVMAALPSSGPPTGGTSVTISGTNFIGVTGVKFGAVNATSYVINSATAITAVSPAGTGTVDITIIAGTQTSAISAADQFKYATVTTQTTLASSPNPSSTGQAVTFTATVSGSGGAPAGSITFRDGGRVLGTAVITGGVAALTVSTLAAGTHSITASYGGSTNYGVSTSQALQQTVNVPPDSVRLQALQNRVTPLIAQNSGQLISNAIDNAIQEGFSDGGTFMSPNGMGVHFNFAADPNQPSAAQAQDQSAPRWSAAGRGAGRGDLADGPIRGSLAYASQGNGGVSDAFAALERSAPVASAPAPKPVQDRNWTLWADLRGSTVERWSSSAGGPQSQFYGYQVNSLVGLTYRATSTFLVGVLGGYETFDYTAQDINGHLKGQGQTIGSYIGWKMLPTLRFQAGLAYSRLSYDGAAGLVQGSFTGDRWLASSGLTGTYGLGAFNVEPSAKIYALWEQESVYTDSAGTAQSARKFFTGRTSAGTQVSYPIAWGDEIKIVPLVGLFGDHYFNKDDGAAILAAGGVPLDSTPILQGWSARTTAGLAIKLASGGALSFGSELAGLGGTTHIWSLRARASAPF